MSSGYTKTITDLKRKGKSAANTYCYETVLYFNATLSFGEFSSNDTHWPTSVSRFVSLGV